MMPDFTEWFVIVAAFFLGYLAHWLVAKKRSRPDLTVRQIIKERATGQNAAYDPSRDDEKIMKGETETYFE